MSVLKRVLTVGAISASLIAVTIGYLTYAAPQSEQPISDKLEQASNGRNLNASYNPSLDSATETSTPTPVFQLPIGEPILGSTEPARNSRPTKPLKPYVALALATTQQTTEELCPELAEETSGSEEAANGQETTPAPATKSERDDKGCVLPIGDEPSAATAQASMPVERPPSFFGRQKVNFMPYVGGLGAAIAAVPVINGLSTNKNDEHQPISPQ